MPTLLQTRTRSSCLRRAALPLAAAVATQGSMLALDLGQEFSEVALVKDRSAEMALNIHSQRKTPTAVSFAGKVRVFGDEALAAVTRTAQGAFAHVVNLLGGEANDDVASALHLRSKAQADDFYSGIRVKANETRGNLEVLSPNSEVSYAPELVYGNLIKYFKEVAEASNDNLPIKDAVITVPSSWSQRQRQALVDAGRIAGLQNVGLIHETSATALQLAMDWQKSDVNLKENVLFYNLGARKCEVCIAEFSPRQAGMVAGRTSPNIVVKGCEVDTRFGGHFADMAIAKEMAKRFTESKPFVAKKLKAADFLANKRGLMKLLKQAKKTRHDLSASKDAYFAVEGLWEELDFASKIKREDFEKLLEDTDDELNDLVKFEAESTADDNKEPVSEESSSEESKSAPSLSTKPNPFGKFWSLVTLPIEKALKKANMTLSDIDTFEVVGGAWRTPRVQQILGEYIAHQSAKESRTKPALELGQHLNGEEASVFGASLFAANASRETGLRPMKRVFFSDTFSDFEYSMDITSLEKEDSSVPPQALKNTTVIASQGSKLGVKKKITLSDSVKDFTIKLFENGKLLTTWKVTGLEEAIEGKYKDLVHPGLLEKARKKLSGEGTASAEEDDSKPDAAAEKGEKKEEDLRVLPKVGFTIGPDSSGIVTLSKKVEALFVETVEEEVIDEAATFERDRKLAVERNAALKEKENATNDTSAENKTESSDANSTSTDDKTDEADKGDEKKSEEGSEDVEEGIEEKTEADSEKKEDSNENATSDKNSTTENENSTTSDESSKTATTTLPPIMKTRFRKKNHIITLNAERIDEMPLPLSQAELSHLQDTLFNMTRKDAEKIELEVLKNDIESYVYNIKEKFEYNEAYKAVSTEEGRAELTKLAEDTELWLEDGISPETELAEVKEKLAALSKLFEPVKARAMEQDSRADFEIQMDKEVAKVAELKKKVVGEMSWLKSEEVEKAVQKYDDFVADWETKKSEQKEKKGFEEPAYLIKTVEGYAERSFAELRRLSKVKKPKERKASASAKGRGKNFKKSVAELEKEIKKVESEISDVQIKKMDAVENDDFDKAEVLKKEEEKKKETLRVLNTQLEEAQKKAKTDAAKKTKKDTKKDAKKDAKKEKKDTKSEESNEGETKTAEKTEESAESENADDTKAEEKGEEKSEPSKSEDKAEGSEL